MLILTLRTDKPEAEIGLFEDEKKLGYVTWQAHRELSETLLGKVEKLLTSNKKSWQDIGGVVCYLGPGSFTGLRIGATLSNSLSYGLDIPVVGAESDEWLEKGLKKVRKAKKKQYISPKYGAPPNITKPKS